MTKTFPKLYKRTSTGAQQEWEISVDGNVITTRYGQTGGKIQIATDMVKEGKNIGRANETTPEQQALLEAESQWIKKQKKDYTRDAVAAMAGASSEFIEGGIIPMTAKRFDEDGDKIVWPAFVQPKLDGHRCVAMVDAKGKCTLWARSRKPIVTMPHIVKAVEALGLTNVTLDGELYNHDYHDKFEELTHFIKRSEAIDGCEVVQYHIYDIAISEPFAARRSALVAMEDMARDMARDITAIGHGVPPLVFVETIEVDDEDAMMVAFEHCLELGYEGCMVRNAKGMYVNKRSADLQKVKQFVDGEFEIVGINEGRGKLAGHGIFVCRLENGGTVEAKMAGDTAKLKEFLEQPHKFIGRKLTIKYQGRTKTGSLRFPVALRLREDL